MYLLLRMRNGEDVCMTIPLALLLAFISGRVVREGSWAWKAGAVVGFLVGIGQVFFFESRHIASSGRLFIAVFVSMILGFLAATVSWIVLGGIDYILIHGLSPLVSVWTSWRKTVALQRYVHQSLEQAQACEEEERQRREAERERLANLPPPPTRAEKIAAIRLRFQHEIEELEKTLTGLELESAKRQLNREMLQELDGLL